MLQVRINILYLLALYKKLLQLLLLSLFVHEYMIQITQINHTKFADKFTPMFYVIDNLLILEYLIIYKTFKYNYLDIF